MAFNCTKCIHAKILSHGMPNWLGSHPIPLKYSSTFLPSFSVISVWFSHNPYFFVCIMIKENLSMTSLSIPTTTPKNWIQTLNRSIFLTCDINFKLCGNLRDLYELILTHKKMFLIYVFHTGNQIIISSFMHFLYQNLINTP